MESERLHFLVLCTKVLGSILLHILNLMCHNVSFYTEFDPWMDDEIIFLFNKSQLDYAECDVTDHKPRPLNLQ